MLNQNDDRKPGFNLALFACFVAVIVIGLGAFTRLVDAGLGCPDWPTCYGHVWVPETAEEINIANQAFAETPVETNKTWPEQIHRIFASSLGLISIFLLAISIRKLRQGDKNPAVKLSVFLLVFIILQGLFGMWTVTLKLWPQVVTLHLLGGFTSLSLLWLLTLRLNNSHWRMTTNEHAKLQALKPRLFMGLIVIICQIALGGWTTSNYAAVACPDLPTCQAQWLPTMDFGQAFNIFQHIGPNYLGGTMDNEARIAIHFSHRIGAIITALYIIVLAIKLSKTLPLTHAKSVPKLLLSVLALQVCLGLANVLFNFPVAVAVAHNLVGALLLVSMVTLMHRIVTAQPNNQ